MVRNVSYNSLKIKAEINSLVGLSYSWLKRIKMGGIGSPKMLILESSWAIQVELKKDTYPDRVYMELRPRGVCLYFRSLLESWVFAIPFRELKIFQSDGKLSFYGNQDWVKVECNSSVHIQAEFMRKLLKMKSERIESVSK